MKKPKQDDERLTLQQRREVILLIARALENLALQRMKIDVRMASDVMEALDQERG